MKDFLKYSFSFKVLTKPSSRWCPTIIFTLERLVLPKTWKLKLFLILIYYIMQTQDIYFPLSLLIDFAWFWRATFGCTHLILSCHNDLICSPPKLAVHVDLSLSKTLNVDRVLFTAWILHGFMSAMATTIHNNVCSPSHCVSFRIFPYTQ